jgi:hypothetical protein
LPAISYLDRGKSSIALPREVGDIVIKLVEGVTAKWAKQKRMEIRDDSARARREERMIRRDRPETIEDVAYDVMRAAYLKASDNNQLPANARQIFYAARGEIHLGSKPAQYALRLQARLSLVSASLQLQCYRYDVIRINKYIFPIFGGASWLKQHMFPNRKAFTLRPAKIP